MAFAACVAALLFYLSTPRLRVERDKLLIATVRRGTFQEYVLLPGEGRRNLGQPSEAVLLDRGAFFRTTGGHWVWLVDEEGGTAVQRQVRLGRQNPEVHEVLSGLAPGDRVITSTYDHLEGAEELVLTH